MTRGIIVADPSNLVRSALAELLTGHGYSVLGLVANGDEALALAVCNPESILLFDESLQHGDGRSWLDCLPLLGTETDAMVLSSSWSVDDVVTALASGVSGLVDKDDAPDRLFAAIDIVADGGTSFCSRAIDLLRGELAEAFAVMRREKTRRYALTDRENEILGRLSSALTLSQIGDQLYLSRKTVRNNASSLYGKLGVSCRAEAVARAMELGLIPPGTACDPV
jgi:DNA-binding NarL/FixJ family response regulator